MYSFKRSLIALVGLLVLVGVLATLLPLVGRGQGTPPNGPPPQDVIVINSAAQPVPVTGSVTVANVGSGRLLVRDVDNPARQPFETNQNCSPSGGALGCQMSFTVPAGKRLVIEYASMHASIPAGEVAELAIGTTVAGTFVEHVLPLTPPSMPFAAGGLVARVGQVVRLYADPGTVIFLNVGRSGVGTPTNFSVSISGHLVDVP
jgi:hypothetical protein